MQQLPNPHLHAYHVSYQPFMYLTTQQINTLSLCSYVADCIHQVESTDYSCAVIPAVRTLEEGLKRKFRLSKRYGRTLNAFVAYAHRYPVQTEHVFDQVGYPDHLMSRFCFFMALKHIAYYRAKAGHAYISRKDVSRCLAWCATLINIVNSIQVHPEPVL